MALSRDSLLRCKALAIVALILAAAALNSPTAEADDAQAGPTTTPQALAHKIPPGRYLFKFKWNGIPAAESEVVIDMRTEEGVPHYYFEGTARTSSLVDIFWRFRASVTALVQAFDGKARRIQTSEQENARFKETDTIFDYELGEAHYTRWKKGQIKKKTIDLGGGLVDLASFGMMLGRRPLEVGDSGGFTVLYKDDSYTLEYKVASRARIFAAGKEHDALRLEPRFRKITQEDKPPKIRRMTIWLSESLPHIPLKLRSKTFIGHVTGELVSVTPLEAEENGQSNSQSQEEPAIPPLSR